LWKWFVIILVAVSLGMVPVVVSAATTQEVTVTATPGYGIISFEVEYISDTQIDLSWVTDDSVTKVMVRAKFNEDLDEIPDEDTEPSDGNLVYYGDASSTSYWTNLETTSYPLYFKIWGQKEDETWYTGAESGFTEGKAMVLAIFGGLALGLSFFGWRSRHLIACIAAAGTWIFLWWYIQGNVTAVTGAGLQLITVICFALAITMLLLGVFRAITVKSTTDVATTYDENEHSGVKGLIHRINADETPSKTKSSNYESAEEYRSKVRSALGRNRPRRRV
jgi:hypothetical protein